jgi:hypothetical protein
MQTTLQLHPQKTKPTDGSVAGVGYWRCDP